MGHVIERILAGAGLFLLACALAWCVGWIVGWLTGVRPRQRDDVFMATSMGFAVIVVVAFALLMLYGIGSLALADVR